MRPPAAERPPPRRQRRQHRHPPSPGQGLAQIGQTLGQYPTKVQVAYKATDKEGTTSATVGQGSINVSDTAKQAALEKSGATGALDKLNRDVTKTQIVTKNTVEAFNVFVSTQSIQTVAAMIGKATDLHRKTLGGRQSLERQGCGPGCAPKTRCRSERPLRLRSGQQQRRRC